MLFRSKIKGIEHGLDVFNDLEGNYIACVPKIKYSMRAGETDVAKTLNNKLLVRLARKLSSKTKHILNLDVDCFINGEDVFILEMNPRFGGQYPFSHVSGVNYPKVIIDLLIGNAICSKDLIFQPIICFKDFEIKKYENVI